MQRQYYVVTMLAEDMHWDLLQKFLDGPLVPIDPRPMIGADLTFEQDQSGDKVFYGDRQLNPPAGIWWRESPGNIAVEGIPWDTIEPYCHEFVRKSVYQHANGLKGIFPDAIHVSDPGAIDQAQAKPLQLRVARGLLRLPRTIQASNPARVQAFATSLFKRDGVCVRKITGNKLPVHPERGPLISPTQVLTPEEIGELDWNTLAYAPGIFQEIIPGTDVTVAVVGEQVFPVEITTDVDQAHTGYLDYRQVGMSVPGKRFYRPCEISDDEAASCIELVKRLGLRYGRIDFIRDHTGRLWFLEINPTGNWGFVELYAGWPVARAIAELLMSTNSPLAAA